jgi:hypothetical protein
MRTSSRRQIARLQRLAVEEATAIVEGHFVDGAADTRFAPRWGWVNKLAHAGWDDLTGLAARHTAPASTWEAAASYLATELLTRSQSPERLLGVQRAGLIPLELDVMAGWIPRPTTPRDLVQMVSAGIDRAVRLGDLPGR